MSKFQVDCLVKGYLPSVPHEDGDLNAAVLEAFDNADFGELQDVDFAPFSDIWAVVGHYLLEVSAVSEHAALKQAQDTFMELVYTGKVDLGDLDLDDVSLEEVSIFDKMKQREDKEFA